jgi:hypothetical protein
LHERRLLVGKRNLQQFLQKGDLMWSLETHLM